MSTGMARVEELYHDRGRYAREAKAEGKPVIGYLCTFTPVEIMHAAGVFPFRIAGNMNESISDAGQYLESIACPFTRSVLDLALNKQYDFLDGYVMPHACDNIVKLYDVWAPNIEHSYAHFVNVPHTISGPALEFFTEELGTFRRSLERYVGHEISDGDLKNSADLSNEQRRLVRRLYEYRKQDPPIISGSEITRVLIAVMSLPFEDANSLLQEVIEEVGNRHGPAFPHSGPRLMIYGTGNEDTTFIELVESLGSKVVIDDLCFGTRAFWYDIEVDGNPLEGIAGSYLEKTNCPRTFRQSPGSHQADLENRFGHISGMAEEYGAKGVICFILRYCDTHSFDLPDLKEHLNQKRLPFLVVEEEYPVASSVDRLKTRLETFFEIIA